MSLARSANASSAAHVALIVEDDLAMAAMLRSLVESMGHGWVHAVTLEDAREAVLGGGFCYVLLDMQIPASPGGPPVVGCGETVLRLLRETFPERTARGKHRLPIIVVTSYSREPEFVTRMLKLDANDFVAKPVERQEIVADKIREALALAEREGHEACAGAARAQAAKTTAGLVIDGREEGRSSVVLVHGDRRTLQNAKFAPLVRMAAALVDSPGAWLAKTSLGIAHAPEVPSRIEKALAGLLPAGERVVESNKTGGVRLNSALGVHVDWAALEKHSEAAVRKLARERKPRG